MGETNQWLDLLMGMLSPEEAEPLVSKAIEELDAFLERDQNTQERVVGILSRRLSGKINAETWQLMHDSLSQYFTEDLAYFLYWVVAVEDPTSNRMQELFEQASPSGKIQSFFRAVVGIFGVDLTDTFIAWNQIPNNWRTIYRDVYFDRINNRDLIKLRILKYNGEETVIEGPPDSILTLANELLYTIHIVGTPEAFKETSINSYLEQSRTLTEYFKKERKKTSRKRPLAKR